MIHSDGGHCADDAPFFFVDVLFLYQSPFKSVKKKEKKIVVTITTTTSSSSPLFLMSHPLFLSKRLGTSLLLLDYVSCARGIEESQQTSPPSAIHHCRCRFQKKQTFEVLNFEPESVII
jgi:hypothetical protein